MAMKKSQPNKPNPFIDITDPKANQKKFGVDKNAAAKEKARYAALMMFKNRKYTK